MKKIYHLGITKLYKIQYLKFNIIQRGSVRKIQSAADILLGSVLGLMASALFAIQVVVFKGHKEAITPVATNTIKMWIAFGFMAVIALLPFRVATSIVTVDAVVVLALSVLLGAALGDLAYISSQNRVGVSVAFPITHSYPVITYIISIALGEAFFLLKFVGVVLAVFGVIMVSRHNNRSTEEDDFSLSKLDRTGLMLAIVASVMLALATILIQVGVQNIDPIDGNLIRMAFGALAMLPIFIVSRLNGMAMPTREASKKITLASLFGFSFGSLFFVQSISYAGATIAAVISSVSPIFALPLTISHLKEKITLRIAAGTMITTVGVVLAILGI